MAATLPKIAATVALVACAANAASLDPRRALYVSPYVATVPADAYTLETDPPRDTTTVLDNCAALVRDVANNVDYYSAYGYSLASDAENAALNECTSASGGTVDRDCTVVTSFCSDDCVAAAFRYDWNAAKTGTGTFDADGFDTGLNPLPASSAITGAVNACTLDACADTQWAQLCRKGIPLCHPAYLLCGMGSIKFANYGTGDLEVSYDIDSADLPARFPVAVSTIVNLMELIAAPEGGFPLSIPAAADVDTTEEVDTTSAVDDTIDAEVTQDTSVVDGVTTQTNTVVIDEITEGQVVTNTGVMSS